MREWTGRFDVALGETGFIQVGPLRVWVSAHPREFAVRTDRSDDPMDPSLAVECPVRSGMIPEGDPDYRFGFREDLPPLHLSARLADRPVVSRPTVPFYLAGGDETMLYVSTPLWIRLHLTEPDRNLVEIPTLRVSDTWYGPNTREGELCYATRTSARIRLEDLPPRPGRAITPVLIRNEALSPLVLDRINLPIPHLSLFRDREGAHWTQRVTWAREEDGEMTRIRWDDEPGVGGKVERVAEPREEASENLLLRVLGSMTK